MCYMGCDIARMIAECERKIAYKFIAKFHLFVNPHQSSPLHHSKAMMCFIFFPSKMECYTSSNGVHTNT